MTGLVMTIFSFNYLKGINLFEKSRTFTVVYQNVEGLEPSNPVTISGYKIGKVQNINISNDGTNKLEIKLLIDNDVKFSKSSKAELYETGLIGGKAIAIIPNYDDKSIALDGDYLIGTIKPGFTELVNQRLSPLQEKLESAIKNADKVMLTINSVFDNETKNSIQESIRNFKNLSMSLNETTENLHSLISDNSNSIDKSLKNIELTSENLSVITENISEANIKDLINNINSTVTGFNSIINKANEWRGECFKISRKRCCV